MPALLTLLLCLSASSSTLAAVGRSDATGPPVFEGGLERSRALAIVLHGGSWSRKEPEELAQRALRELSSDARSVRLRLLAPCAPQTAIIWEDGEDADEGGAPSTERRRRRGDDDDRRSSSTDRRPNDAGRRARRAEDHEPSDAPDADLRSATLLDGSVPWISPAGERRVLNLIDRELSLGRADPDRIYLVGHGSGATGAIMLAARHPDRIAAVAAWSGTPSPLWDEERRVVGLVEDPVASLADVPVYLWTAHDDPILDQETLAVFVESMRRRERGDDRYELVWEQGEGGHGYGRRGPRAGLKFLKERRREGG